jgi:hypothetical protein
MDEIYGWDSQKNFNVFGYGYDSCDNLKLSSIFRCKFKFKYKD